MRMRCSLFRPANLGLIVFMVCATAVFAQPGLGPRGPVDPGLRQRLERATGNVLRPQTLGQVRQAQLEYIERQDKIAKETASTIAGIIKTSPDDVPEPPRPGRESAQADSIYIQAVERRTGKMLSQAERSSLAAALAEHRAEQKRNVDRYARDLVSAVPHLTKAEAEEILAPLGTKHD